MKNAAKLIMNNLPLVQVAIKKLAEKDVLVGVPQDTTARKEAEPQGMNNATLAYIHDNGSPAAHIPARPFMRPGVETAKDKIKDRFKRAAKDALAGNATQDEHLIKCGLAVQSSIRAAINSGIPPPLADSTLRGRIRARKAIKGAKAELESRAAGNEAGVDLAKPLVATAQMRNSITFVIRKKKRK